ncbi:uncharacterized protein LOC141854627 [Brevipalpus obovatus]|uniref:uncharacterized protein LOC141854627 n=1 Tax=Brevipalpus obovatus TaxID=246614 RepID=UPI003D9E324F
MNSSFALVFLACFIPAVVLGEGEEAVAANPGPGPKLLDNFNNFNNNAELMDKLKKQLGERNELFQAVQETAKRGGDFARGVLNVASEFGKFGIDAMKTVMEHEKVIANAKNDDFFAKVRKNIAEKAQNLRNGLGQGIEQPAAQ